MCPYALPAYLSPSSQPPALPTLPAQSSRKIALILPLCCPHTFSRTCWQQLPCVKLSTAPLPRTRSAASGSGNKHHFTSLRIVCCPQSTVEVCPAESLATSCCACLSSKHCHTNESDQTRANGARCSFCSATVGTSVKGTRRTEAMNNKGQMQH